MGICSSLKSVQKNIADMIDQSLASLEQTAFSHLNCHTKHAVCRLEGILAFMFETTYMFRLSPYASQKQLQDTDYYKCWQDLKPVFQG